MRLFVAVDPTEEIRARIGQLIEKLKMPGDGIKWVEEKNLHLTLKFLGEVKDQDLDKVIREVEAAAEGRESFKVTFKGLGKFPHVIWIGLKEGEKELKGIAEKLGTEDFSAHLTIGRVKEKKGALNLEEFKENELGEMRAEKIKLIKSTLTPQGPIYEIIKEVNLCRMKS